MRRIEDLAELRGVIGAGPGRRVGNLYWLAADLRDFIERGSLYRLPSDNGIGLVLKRAGRNQFCFHAFERDVDRFACDFEPGTSYVGELVFQRGRPEKCDGERRILERLGFRLHSRAMSLSISREEMLRRSSPKCPKGYSSRFARREDAPAIEALLRRELDPATDDLELGEELARAIGEGRAWVAIAPDGSLCGCLVLKYFGGAAWMRHLVIAREHRGLGLTDPLNYRIAEGEAAGTVFHIWVKEDNLPSRGLTAKLGFEIGPRGMEIWIR